MFLNVFWILSFLLPLSGFSHFWNQPDRTFATRFDFQGEAITYQSGSQVALTVTLVVLALNLMFLVFHLSANKPGFIKLTNFPNKDYWLKKGQLPQKIREVLALTAIWLNIFFYALSFYIQKANDGNTEPQLPISFPYFFAVMISVFALVMYFRTRTPKINSSQR